MLYVVYLCKKVRFLEANKSVIERLCDEKKGNKRRKVGFTSVKITSCANETYVWGNYSVERRTIILKDGKESQKTLFDTMQSF